MRQTVWATGACPSSDEAMVNHVVADPLFGVTFRLRPVVAEQSCEHEGLVPVEALDDLLVHEFGGGAAGADKPGLHKPREHGVIQITGYVVVREPNRSMRALEPRVLAQLLEVVEGEVHAWDHVGRARAVYSGCCHRCVSTSAVYSASRGGGGGATGYTFDAGGLGPVPGAAALVRRPGNRPAGPQALDEGHILRIWCMVAGSPVRCRARGLRGAEATRRGSGRFLAHI
jgi:hypothetical protein